MNATARKAALVVGFGLGVLSGLIASWFLLPLYVQLLLLVAAQVDKHNALHGILLAIGLVISATPIGFGNTFLLIIVSITYGWYAMPMVYFCCVLAGCITFYSALFFIDRKYITIEGVQRRFPAYSKHISSLDKAISSHGTMSACLLQMSACPYGIACALLPFTKIKRLSFLIGTCLSRFKMLPWVYVGMSTTDIAGMFQKIRSGASLQELDFQTVLSIIAAVSTCIFLLLIGYFSQKQLDSFRSENTELSIAQPSEKAPQPIEVNPSKNIQFAIPPQDQSI